MTNQSASEAETKTNPKPTDSEQLKAIYRKVVNYGFQVMGHEVTEGDEAWIYEQFEESIAQRDQQRFAAAQLAEQSNTRADTNGNVWYMTDVDSGKEITQLERIDQLLALLDSDYEQFVKDLDGDKTALTAALGPDAIRLRDNVNNENTTRLKNDAQ